MRSTIATSEIARKHNLRRPKRLSKMKVERSERVSVPNHTSKPFSTARCGGTVQITASQSASPQGEMYPCFTGGQFDKIVNLIS
jgi:hypothetical protein